MNHFEGIKIPKALIGSAHVCVWDFFFQWDGTFLTHATHESREEEPGQIIDFCVILFFKVLTCMWFFDGRNGSGQWKVTSLWKYYHFRSRYVINRQICLVGRSRQKFPCSFYPPFFRQILDYSESLC